MSEIADRAAEWLLDQLAAGPMRSADLLVAGKLLGYGRDLLGRLRKRLGVVAKYREGCWWAEIPSGALPQPRGRVKDPGPGEVSMATVIDRAGLGGTLGLVAEFERWASPGGAVSRYGSKFDPARAAAIVGFIARTGSINVAGDFAGVSSQCIRAWLDRGRADMDKRQQAEREGRELAPTAYEVFLRQTMMAKGWLDGKVMGVLVDAALGGDVRAIQTYLRIAGIEQQQLEITHRVEGMTDEELRDRHREKVEETQRRHLALVGGE